MRECTSANLRVRRLRLRRRRMSDSEGAIATLRLSRSCVRVHNYVNGNFWISIRRQI